jgi:hypothetical protein
MAYDAPRTIMPIAGWPEERAREVQISVSGTLGPRFASDSPLEEAGFELLVPRKTRPASLPCLGSRSRRLFWYRQATWCELADFFFD